MEIILVRHASTAWSGQRYCGRSDPPLNGDGEGQAAELAARLAPTLDRDVRILSSPSQRAVATATAIAGAIGANHDIELDDRWLETDFGVAEGRSFDEVALEFPELARWILAGSISVDWPGGERAMALEARVRAAWEDLTGRRRDALVVTHAGPLLHAIALAQGIAPDIASIPSPGSAMRFEVSGAGVDRRPVLGSRP